MRNFVNEGYRLTLAAPSGGVVSGQAVLFGSLLGVAVDTAAAGALCPFQVKGVIDLPKASGETWTVGEVLYWDNTNHDVTATSTSNTKIGCAAAAQGSTDTVGAVLLNGTV